MASQKTRLERRQRNECQQCGAPAFLKKSGKYATRCEPHLVNQKNRDAIYRDGAGVPLRPATQRRLANFGGRRSSAAAAEKLRLREQDVRALAADGLNVNQIAEVLGLTGQLVRRAAYRARVDIVRAPGGRPPGRRSSICQAQILRVGRLEPCGTCVGCQTKDAFERALEDMPKCGCGLRIFTGAFCCGDHCDAGLKTTGLGGGQWIQDTADRDDGTPWRSRCVTK